MNVFAEHNSHYTISNNVGLNRQSSFTPVSIQAFFGNYENVNIRLWKMTAQRFPIF